MKETCAKDRTLAPLKTLSLFAALVLAVAGVAKEARSQAVSTVTILASDYPPYEMEQPVNGLRGFDHEVVVEAFKRKNLKAEIFYAPWTRALTNAKNGDSDALLSCAYTEARTEFFHYSKPISREVYGVYYRTNGHQPDIAELRDLKDFSIAAVSDYIANVDLDELDLSPVEVPSDLAGLKMLALGRFDFFYSGKAATDYLIKQNSMGGLFRFRELSAKDYYLCIHRDNDRGTDLLNLFNSGLVEIKADGTYDAIHAKYR